MSRAFESRFEYPIFDGIVRMLLDHTTRTMLLKKDEVTYIYIQTRLFKIRYKSCPLVLSRGLLLLPHIPIKALTKPVQHPLALTLFCHHGASLTYPIPID